jgi:hypothetical protein
MFFRMNGGEKFAVPDGFGDFFRGTFFGIGHIDQFHHCSQGAERIFPRDAF